MCLSGRRSLAPLVKAGYVAFVYGGAKEGAYLCKHELVEALHLTGSAATYDAIVWGSDKAKVSHMPEPRHLFRRCHLLIPTCPVFSFSLLGSLTVSAFKAGAC